MDISEPKPGNSSPNPERFKAYIGLLSDISFLITELQAYRDGKDPFYRYEFDLFQRDDVDLPSIIDQVMPYPDLVAINLREEDDEVVFGSIDFINRVATFSLSSLTGVTNDSLLSVTKQPNRTEPLPDEIPPVGYASIAELNNLIMSLAIPGSRDNRPDSGDAEILKPSAFPALVESLNKTRAAQVTSVGNPLEVTGLKLDYQEKDGDPTTFQITYPDEKTGQSIYADGSLDTGLQLPFYTIEQTSVVLIGDNSKFETTSQGSQIVDLGSTADTVKIPRFPTVEEINYLRTLVQTELNILNPVEHYITEEDLPPALEGIGEAFLNGGVERFSPKYIENVLHELPFDPSDPSA